MLNRAGAGRSLRLPSIALLLLVSLTAPAGAVEVETPVPGRFSCTAQDLQPVQVIEFDRFKGYQRVMKPVVQAVPGKAGENGRLLYTLSDAKGNKIEVWCLEANAKHGGPDLGYLYTPQGGNGVWIGACTLVTGQNYFTMTADVQQGGAFQYTKFRWDNWEKDDGTANKKKDFHYTYDVAADRLTIARSEGQYVNSPIIGNPREYKSKIVETQNGGPVPAPQNFEGLSLNGVQVTLGSGEGGIATETFLVRLDPRSPPGEYRYTITADAPRGSGIQEDDFGGPRTVVQAGDVFTVRGVGIQDPSISGLASQTEFGRWVVGDFDDTFVSFQATERAELRPGDAITGFSFITDTGGGEVVWTLGTGNESSGGIGFAAGTVATKVTGSASRVGLVPPAGKDAGAQIRVAVKFPVDESVNLVGSTVRIHSVLAEVGPDGVGELIKGIDGADLLPITLSPRPNGTASAATFQTPSGEIPQLRLDIQSRGGGVYDWLLKVDRATIPVFPNLCAGARPVTTALATAFTIDDGVSPPVVVETVEAWRCLDLLGGDPHHPRSLRVP